jgi:dihydrofolate reductase
MRTLIVSEFVTLDGVMEAPGGEPTHPHSGWVFDFAGEEQFAYKLDEVLAADVLLIGRVTYENFVAAWPEREGDFADKMNGMPKVVVSNTLHDPEWNNTTVLSSDVVKGITELKGVDDDAVVLVAGSATLVHTLLDHDLVDELRLMVFPVSIGAGLRAFPDTIKKTTWRRVESVTFQTEVRVDTFRRG